MTAYLDEEYFGWLYAQIARPGRRSPSNMYYHLCQILFTTEFTWCVPYDDNRVQDGKDLRYAFLEEEEIRVDNDHWLHLECSMFELMVALARHLAFETDTEPNIWFFEMLENLHLDKYNDRAHIHRPQIEAILNRVIQRTYEPDGSGGLFPLVNHDKDQREVELWHQLNSYILERGY